MAMHKSRITIIGAGSLGTALACLMVQLGHPVTLGSRDLTRCKKDLANLLGPAAPQPSVADPCSAITDGDLVLLTVPDDVIESVCIEIAEQLVDTNTVVHFSGALDSDVLATAQLRGCAVGSLHPLNSFPNPSAALTTLSNPNHQTSLYWEGDAALAERVLPLFKTLGFSPCPISKSAKPLYHAACVMACNLLTALMEVSLQAAASANLDREQFWLAIQPLVQTTLSNISSTGTAQALSGPIARGDTETVAKQLKSLAMHAPDLLGVYRGLSTHACKLAQQSPLAKPAALTEIARLLED